MPESSQNPRAAFEDIVDGIATPTLWQTAFDMAEDQLREINPEGFNVEDIGRRAWDELPPAEKEIALGELFYTYWSCLQSDAEEMDRWERERDTREALKNQLALIKASEYVPVELLRNVATLAALLVGGAA